MVVSTGVGGGIVLDGRLLDGADGNAGHIGHVIVEPDGRPCACGAPRLPRGRGVGHRHRRPHRAPAAGGGTAAERRRAGRLVGRAVASVANLLDLRLAVVAGSVALGFGDASSPPPRPSSTRVGPARASPAAPRIVPAGLGADGPLVGAAAVGWRGLGPDSGS